MKTIWNNWMVKNKLLMKINKIKTKTKTSKDLGGDYWHLPRLNRINSLIIKMKSLTGLRNQKSDQRKGWSTRLTYWRILSKIFNRFIVIELLRRLILKLRVKVQQFLIKISKVLALMVSIKKIVNVQPRRWLL